MNLLVGNFDFEHHLARDSSRTLSAAIQRINAELAFALIAFAQPGDFIWAPAPPEPEYLAYLATLRLPGIRFVSAPAEVPHGANVVPWGWSGDLKSWALQNGWQCDAPNPAVVALVNSRAFSSSLESEWNVGLPRARTIRTLDSFQEAIEASGAKNPAWVVKANFGMSARERILGRGTPPSPQAVQWVQKQLVENDAVYFEPWVERIEEVGVQFTIPKEGEPLLEGITPLLTDHLGTYRGSRFRGVSCQLARTNEFTAVLDIVTQSARRIQELGYFGILGIDAMCYRTEDGEVRWRPLQDINARLTMGRLALGIQRIVPESQHATWLHVSRSEKKASGNAPSVTDVTELLTGTRLVRTSPLTIGGNAASRSSFVVTASTDEALLSIETRASSVDLLS